MRDNFVRFIVYVLILKYLLHLILYYPLSRSFLFKKTIVFCVLTRCGAIVTEKLCFLQNTLFNFLNKLQFIVLFSLEIFHSSGLKFLFHFKTSSILFGNGLFNVSGTYKQVNPQMIAMNPYITDGNHGITLV